MGFCKKYIEFPLGNTFNYVGIRFLPTMFPQIFKLDASKLSNRFVKLATMESQLSNYIAENFNERQNLDNH